MKRWIASLTGLLVLVLLVSPPLAGQEDKKENDKEENLLVNGSFEEGPATGGQGFTWLNEGSKDLKGWTVTRGQISYMETYQGQKWQHADGKRSLDLHGNPGYGGVKQAFKTKKGQKYRVTFSLAGNPMGTVPMKELGVSAAGKEEKFTFDCTDKTITDMGWSTQVWDFTAAEDETTLEFHSLMTQCGDNGPALDNVSVKAVKE